MTPAWYSALIGAITTFALTSLAAASTAGALLWRMRAAEARLKALECGHGVVRDSVADLKAQIAGLESTISALTRAVESLTIKMGSR